MKQKIFFILIILMGLLLSSCATAPQAIAQPRVEAATSEPTQEAIPTPVKTNRYLVPAYYSIFYNDTILASQQEAGLLIYSSLSKENWAPIIEAFNNHYPWINVTVIELSPTDVFERYKNEEAADLRTADMIVSYDLTKWHEFIELANIRTYSSPETPFLPEWSQPAIGIYTMAPDPLLIIYNKAYYPIYNKGFNLGTAKTPASLQSLVETIQENKDALFNRVGGLSAENNLIGFTSNWAYSHSNEALSLQKLTVIGEAAPLMFTSENEIIDYVADGRLFAAYFVPASSVLPNLNSHPFIDFLYISDGQPVLLHNMAITQAGASPESAKLMLDYILSQEGQLALSLGSLTPYRTDVENVTNDHFNKIIAQIGGAQNVIFITLDNNLLDENLRNDFLIQWKTTLQQ